MGNFYLKQVQKDVEKNWESSLISSDVKLKTMMRSPRNNQEEKKDLEQKKEPEVDKAH